MRPAPPSVHRPFLPRLYRAGPRLYYAVVLLLLAGSSVSISARAVRTPDYVLPCVGITLTASYLADVGGAGPGFLFRIDNHTPRPIRLAEPVPSGADWYAGVGDRWLWRASAGRGGALVDAERPRGPMFAFRSAVAQADPDLLTVPPHGSQQWTEAMRNNPTIDYQPGCPMCSYPGETSYQAVFAYAYLPAAEEHIPDLLRCGLRSVPVPMPPRPAQH